MKKVTEQMGKTVEEAIRKGLEELKVSRDDVKSKFLKNQFQEEYSEFYQQSLLRLDLQLIKR